MTTAIGPHEVEIQGDLIKLVIHGPFTLDDMQRYMPLREAQTAANGYVLLLIDLNDAVSLSAEARRFAADRNREARARGPVYGANASFGGGALVRGATALFQAIVKLVTGGGIHTHQARTEAEARAFLDAQRRSFRAQLGKD